MVVGAGFPEQRTLDGIERVHVAAKVAEVNGLVVEDRRYADTGRGGVGPVDASTAGIERIYCAIGSAYEDPAAENRWASKGTGDAWEAKSPF